MSNTTMTRRQRAAVLLDQSNRLQAIEPGTLAYDVALNAIEDALLQAERAAIEAQCAAVQGFSDAMVDQGAVRFPEIFRNATSSTVAAMRIVGAERIRRAS